MTGHKSDPFTKHMMIGWWQKLVLCWLIWIWLWTFRLHIQLCI